MQKGHGSDCSQRGKTCTIGVLISNFKVRIKQKLNILSKAGLNRISSPFLMKKPTIKRTVLSKKGHFYRNASFLGSLSETEASFTPLFSYTQEYTFFHF